MAAKKVDFSTFQYKLDQMLFFSLTKTKTVNIHDLFKDEITFYKVIFERFQ